MVEVSPEAPRSLADIPPLPPFARVGDLVLDALPLLDPPTRMSVTDAAERYVKIPRAGMWRDFDREVTPYMVEPADITQSRRYRAVPFVGPSQTGKTVFLQNVAAHAVMCHQAPMHIVHMTQADAHAWVEDKLNPMIENSPELRDRLGKSAQDNTLSRKRFKGMPLTIGWPVAQQLSSRTLRAVLFTDYDHHPQILGPKDMPEGTGFTLGLNRVLTFMSVGFVALESSPAFPCLKPGWKPSKRFPHMLPPTALGIVAIYNDSTRARWYWECPDCGGEFEPRFDRLIIDGTKDPQAAGDAAEMPCPHCGSLIAHRHKVELNRRGLKGHGGWRHESKDGTPVAIDDAEIRDVDVVGYALNGAAAAFRSWSDMVVRWLSAQAKFKAFDDTLELTTFAYTVEGVPFVPPKLEGDDEELTLEALRAKCVSLERGVAPAWARFVVISVDVQGTYFDVQSTAFGLDGRRAIVDRWQITQPPADAPGMNADAPRKLDPAEYAEDWAQLEPLFVRQTPVADSDYDLVPVAVVIDFQGAPGVSDNAEAFKVRMQANHLGKRVFLSIGRGTGRTDYRVKHAFPEGAQAGAKARRVKLLYMNTDRLKDTVFAAAKRDTQARNALIIGDWAEDAVLEELIAEERTKNGWQKKAGQRRNETFDLCVQAQAVAELKMLSKLDPSDPPEWAVIGAANPFAVLRDTPEVKDAPATTRRTDRLRRLNYLT